MKDIQYYLESARHHLEDYTDEIPSEVLHNIHSTHKVSMGWFSHIVWIFGLAYKRGFVDESYGKRILHYIKNSGLDSRLTKKEDIEFVDELLREFIGELSS